MWFFGLLLLAAAGGFAFGHRARQRKLGLIASTEVCTVGHLRELAASMREGLGAGSLRFPAAVSGTVRCDEPLLSQLAEAPAVYYSMSVRREIEAQRKAADGDSEAERSERRSEQLAHERRSVAFTIEDDTGTLAVEPAGASFTTEKAVSRFEPAAAGPQTLSLGRFTRELPGLAADPDTRTLGYRFDEEIVSVGKEVFVLGEVTDPGGELQMASPAEKGQFIISVESRQQLLREAGSSSRFMRRAAIVCGVLGLLLLIL